MKNVVLMVLKEELNVMRDVMELDPLIAVKRDMKTDETPEKSHEEIQHQENVRRDLIGLYNHCDLTRCPSSISMACFGSYRALKI
jgi:hypothetical protein